MNTSAEPRRTHLILATLCGLAIGTFTGRMDAEEPPPANVILIEVDGLDLKNLDTNRTPRLAKFREEWESRTLLAGLRHLPRRQSQAA